MKKMFVTGVLSMAMLGLSFSAFAVNWRTDPLNNSHKVDYKTLPVAVREATHKHIGNKSHVEDVDKGTLGGKTVYEIAFKKDEKSNKTYEVRISADGKVLGEHGD
jgi:hypothetical protein